MRAAAGLPAGVTVAHFRVWCDRTPAVPWRTAWQHFVAERAAWEPAFRAVPCPSVVKVPVPAVPHAGPTPARNPHSALRNPQSAWLDRLRQIPA